jgi:hypothetical protein
VVELTDVEIFDGTIREPLLGADDQTSATSNSSRNTSSMSSKSKSFADARWAHSLTKALVAAVFFQCRMEYHIRQYFALLFTTRKENLFVGTAKRKNSNMVVVSNNLGDTRHDAAIRCRSDIGDAGFDDIPGSPAAELDSPKSVASGCQQDRKIMRRNQNLTNFV